MHRKNRSKAVTLAFIALCAARAPAQDYGYAQGDVPTTIADKGAKVLPVLTKHPETGRALGFCDGPAVDAEGNLFFAEPGSHSIFKVTPEGQASVFFSGTIEAPAGMEFDPQGRLLVCSKGAILRFSRTGAKEVFAASGEGVDFKDLQDITIGSNGSMYVTNYRSGKTVFQVSADGKAIRQIPGLASPTGVEWLEEKKILYVSDFDPHTTWQYDVGADGSLANKRPYVPDIPGAFGITMDVKEDVYISGFTQGSIHLYSPGKKDPFLGHILVKGSPVANGNNSNQVFGGPGNKTLFITGNGGCFRIQLNIAGRVRPAGPSAIRPRLRMLRHGARFPLGELRDFSGRLRNSALTRETEFRLFRIP